MYSVGLAYLLWFVSGCGALGFHRFYLGKIPTGLLWMFTGGLGMVGSIYDFFTLSRQVREANFRDALLQDRVAGTDRVIYDGVTSFVSTPAESVERIILKLAKSNKGIVAISDVALEANISVDDAKKDLEELVNKGFVEMRVRKTGAIVYVIREYLENNSEFEEF
jgi:hypothetical protein